MTNIKAFIHGVYPRSTELVKVSRDVDRKRASNEELEKQREKDYAGLQKLQKTAGFDYLEDGKFSWHDIFRPIIQATEGMEVGALTRWFNNNSFYRQPIIMGKLRLNEKKLDGFFPNLPKTQWKVTLPSPYTFAKLTGNTAATTFENTLSEITNLLTGVAQYVVKKGVAFVQFNEPYIPYHGATKAELVLIREALVSIKKELKGTKIALHSYFGSSLPLVTALAESRSVDVVGVDFYHTSLLSLPKKLPCDIIAGVVEGRNSLLENKVMLKAFVEKAVMHLQPNVLYLSNNSDLDLLPEAVAGEKVKLLGEVI